MYLYGRNSIKFLTMFDFDHNDYLNRIEIEVNYNPELRQFTNILCYQGNSYETNTALGTIKKYDAKETPLNVSTITSSGTTVTVTTSSPHGLRAGQEIRVFGSSIKEFNTNIGFLLPFDLTANSFKYQVPFAPPSTSTTATVVYITTTFTLETQNKIFVKTKDLYCIDAKVDGSGDVIVPFTSINAIGQALSVTGGSVYFEETEETLDILRKTTTGWLIGSSREPNYWNALSPDDQIKIDGEDEYRTILSIPSEVIKTEYRETEDVTTGYLGKISTTNYNGIQLGEGLDIICNVDTDITSSTYGQVISLIWNKKDYGRYESKGILPRPAGYGYENAPRLNFVPQALKDEGGSVISPAAGGGASGYVVVHNGEPIDVVLTDGGSGYESAPKVYITRGYYVKKSKKNSHHRIITNFFTPLILSNRLVITSGALLSAEQEPPIIIIDIFAPVTIANSDIVITAIIQTQAKPEIPVIQPRVIIDVYLQIGPVQVTSLSALSSIVSSSIESGIEKVEEECTVTIIDSLREILISARSFLKLIQTPIYPALHDTGGYLQSPLSKTDSIIYIADTSKFTISGRLMIDGEIIRYDNKLSDRFLNASRGVDGTSPSTHDAGTFVRQYRENVTIVSVGMSGAGSTSDIISVGSIQTGSASVADIITTVQKTTNPNIVSVGDEITLVIQDNIFTNSVADVSGFITVSTSQFSLGTVSLQSGSVADIITTVQKISNPNIVSVGDNITLVIQDVINTNSVSDVSGFITVSSSQFSLGTVSLQSGSVADIISSIQQTTNPNIVSVGDEITLTVNTSINSNSVIDVSIIRTVESRIQKIVDLISITGITNNIISIVENKNIIEPKVTSITFAVEKFYKTGIIDYYVENVVLDGFVLTRLGTTIVLDAPIQTINLRGGSTINVENVSIRYDSNLDSYTVGNVGNYISTIESWKFMDTGTVPNGGTSIEELELNYGSLSLNDFQQVKFTSYISTGVYYNGGYPSISESGAILNTNMTTTSTSLSVQTVNGSSTTLSKFPSSGYIRIGNEVISYTGKTTVSLTGITRSVNGVVETHSIGDYLRTTN
jgi:hypothetical protein